MNQINGHKHYKIWQINKQKNMNPKKAVMLHKLLNQKEEKYKKSK